MSAGSSSLRRGQALRRRQLLQLQHPEQVMAASRSTSPARGGPCLSCPTIRSTGRARLNGARWPLPLRTSFPSMNSSACGPSIKINRWGRIGNCRLSRPCSCTYRTSASHSSPAADSPEEFAARSGSPRRRDARQGRSGLSNSMGLTESPSRASLRGLPASSTPAV